MSTAPERLIRLRPSDCRPDAWCDDLAGRFLEPAMVPTVLDDDCTVLKPDGSPLLIYRRHVLPQAVCAAAYEGLRTAAASTTNRGTAAGRLDEVLAQGKGLGRARPGVIKGTRFYPINSDGTRSKTNYAARVESGVVGYFDRNPRFPYCRLTAWSMEHWSRWTAALPFIRAVGEVFRRELPDRWRNQQEMVARTSPDFTIAGTPFTTLTVNRNFRTAVHKDAGDLKAGFGVMTCFRAGRYSGGLTGFPKYGVACDMRTGGVLLADVHEWHGNTPMVGESDAPFERISCVFYYREKMHECGSAEQELARVRARAPKRREERPK